MPRDFSPHVHHGPPGAPRVVQPAGLVVRPPIVAPPAIAIQRAARPGPLPPGPPPRVAPPQRLVAGAPIQRKPAAPIPAPAANVIQRVAVKLQPQDPVVTTLVGYAQRQLGMRGHAQDSLAAAAKELGAREHVYLFGHGGNSRIDLERHDKFGGKTIAELAQEIAAHLRFPRGYRGIIYLIGCKTRSVVEDLRFALRARVGQALDVRGTPELLQTKGQDIVLRDAPRNGGEMRMREMIDIQRHYLGTFRRLRDLRREAALDLGNAHDRLTKRAAVIKVIEQQEWLKGAVTEVDRGLDLLAHARVPALVGRRSGLEEVRSVLMTAQTIRAQIIAALEKVFEHWRLQTDDAAPIATLRRLLADNARELGETLAVWQIMISVHDEPDVLHSRPFRLRQMRNRRVRPPRPPRVSMRELGRDMNIYDLLDAHSGPGAMRQAERIARRHNKRL